MHHHFSLKDCFSRLRRDRNDGFSQLWYQHSGGVSFSFNNNYNFPFYGFRLEIGA